MRKSNAIALASVIDLHRVAACRDDSPMWMKSRPWTIRPRQRVRRMMILEALRHLLGEVEVEMTMIKTIRLPTTMVPLNWNKTRVLPRCALVWKRSTIPLRALLHPLQHPLPLDVDLP